MKQKVWLVIGKSHPDYYVGASYDVEVNGNHGYEDHIETCAGLTFAEKETAQKIADQLNARIVLDGNFGDTQEYFVAEAALNCDKLQQC